MLDRPELPSFMGFGIEARAIIPDGSILWFKGDELLCVTKIAEDRIAFFSQFGLMTKGPSNADNMLVSENTYRELIKAFEVAGRLLDLNGECEA